MDDLRQKLSRILNGAVGREEHKQTPEWKVPDVAPREPSIRDRLHRLGLKSASGLAAGVGLIGQRHRLEEVLVGEIVTTPFGECLEIKSTYKSQFRHGPYCLEDFFQIDLRDLDRICGGTGFDKIDPEEVLFVDLETTGLSLGAGTWVFLAGFGFFRSGQYHVRQLFLRDFAEEAAFLFQAGRRMEGFRYVVTFNGKRFDIPLLEGRYALHRNAHGLPTLVQWDLLYPARRLWRGRLEDCKLETIEQERLLLNREDNDIRGERIPEIYLRYIHTGEAGCLHRVVYHNAMDILTLASLAVHVQRSSQEKDPRQVNLLSLGRYYERIGIHEEGRRCYEIVSSRGPTREERELGSLQLAMRRKREGRIEDAIAGWEALIREGSPHRTACCEELAKHYEHRTKELVKAIRMVEIALEGIDPLNGRLRTQLDQRLKRLLKKRGKKS